MSRESFTLECCRNTFIYFARSICEVRIAPARSFESVFYLLSAPRVGAWSHKASLTCFCNHGSELFSIEVARLRLCVYILAVGGRDIRDVVHPPET